MLRQRIIVGAVGGAAAVVILCLGVKWLAAAMALVAVVGLSEIYNATGILKKQNTLCIFGYIYTLGMFAAIAFAPNPAFALAFAVILYAVVLLVYMIFNHNTIGFSETAQLFFATMYVSAFCAHVVLVRSEAAGEYIIWIIFITAWLSDTTAFAVGRRFGRNKLLPEVSPKKTVEGAIGGLAGSVVFNLIFGFVCSAVFSRSVYYLPLTALAVLAGVMSQLGDLAASCIKREYGIKDFSNLLPGHGGVLDRFDSVLFVAPVVYYFAAAFSVIA